MSVVEGERSGVRSLLQPRPPLAPPPSRRRRRAVVLVMAVLLVVATSVGAGLLWSAAPSVRHLGDPFAALPAGARPTAAPAAGTATNTLVIGSDSRGAGAPGGQRSDVLVVVHLAADGRSAQVVSLPRDAWVPVPGHGTTKINAAFAVGGAPLAVQTVEQLTGVRIDHVVEVDFTGFAAVTDALGGVRVCVPATTTDGIGTVPAGCSTMDGRQALEYVRQRKTLPGGDFDRERRQQNWMRSVLTGLTDRDVASHPLELAAVVRALAASVRTDDGLGEAQLLSLAVAHRSLRADDVDFLQAPLASPATGYEGSQSVVHLDPVAGAELWAAVRDDDAASWAARHPDARLGDVVR